jgi:hypothetical protein
MIKLSNQRGQSSVEAAVMALFLVLFIVALLGGLYLMYSSYWVEHVMYESLICYQERGQKQICLSEAKRKLNRILFFRKNLEIKIVDRGSRVQSHFKMSFQPPMLHPVSLKLMKELRI